MYEFGSREVRVAVVAAAEGNGAVDLHPTEKRMQAEVRRLAAEEFGRYAQFGRVSTELDNLGEFLSESEYEAVLAGETVEVSVPDIALMDFLTL